MVSSSSRRQGLTRPTRRGGNARQQLAGRHAQVASRSKRNVEDSVGIVGVRSWFQSSREFVGGLQALFASDGTPDERSM
jgi:hypothetical protein